jgi:tetratricopeptide (TPR) repeat protein
VTERGWQTARIDEIPRLGKTWIPVRKYFGIRAFGVNVWVADAEGDDVIGEHVEDSGHEELYFVSSGRATFTVDGKETDAPAGTLVFVGDPQLSRKAVAREPGTTILTVGAKPGEAFEVMNWETTAEMWPLYEAGDYEGAAALLREALAREPEPGIYYNLACMEALLGQTDEAIEHLRHAADEPRFREAAATDSDLDSLRDDPRFASLLETS